MLDLDPRPMTYQRMQKSTKIFIPLEAFDSYVNDYSYDYSRDMRSGEYLGSLQVGMLGVTKLRQEFPTAAQVARFNNENLNTITANEADGRASLSSQEAMESLHSMYSSNIVSRPQGLGSRAGLWIDADLAVQLGLVAASVDSAVKPQINFASQMHRYRARNHQRAQTSPKFKTTNEYKDRRFGNRQYGKFG